MAVVRKPEFWICAIPGTVEETLNTMLDAEADQLCGAARYERSQARQDTWAGSSERTLQTSATAWSAKCYMNMLPLYQPQVTQIEAVA